MNNPMTWSLPLFRAFGVLIKVHVLFFVVTLGLFLREVLREGAYVSPLDAFLFPVVMLFGVILLHEFGHVFGGRAVGGECEEILIWPLGGLALVDTPREWRAHTFTAFAGPLTNILLCTLTTAVLAGAGFIPTLNPLANPYISPMKSVRDGRIYTSEYGLKLYDSGSSTPTAGTENPNIGGKPDANKATAEQHPNLERALAPAWVVWVNRLFWLNYVLTLLNFIPAFPLDGGQMLQGFVWGRSDYRQGTVVACLGGYASAFVMLLASFAYDATWLVFLTAFVFLSCYLKLQTIREGEGEYGYGGYGMEEDDPPPKKPRKPGFFKRWLQGRAARRLKREHEQRSRDDARMDELLDKIARKEPLTSEEKRFMQRVSERYRK